MYRAAAGEEAAISYDDVDTFGAVWNAGAGRADGRAANAVSAQFPQ